METDILHHRKNRIQTNKLRKQSIKPNIYEKYLQTIPGPNPKDFFAKY